MTPQDWRQAMAAAIAAVQALPIEVGLNAETANAFEGGLEAAVTALTALRDTPPPGDRLQPVANSDTIGPTLSPPPPAPEPHKGWCAALMSDKLGHRPEACDCQPVAPAPVAPVAIPWSAAEIERERVWVRGFDGATKACAMLRTLAAIQQAREEGR